MAKMLQNDEDLVPSRMSWYNDELLTMVHLINFIDVPID